MNPYTGQTTPIARLEMYDKMLWRQAQDRAAKEVGLDDPADLVLIEGTEDHIKRLSDAVKAQAKAERRAANKRARKSRKQNR